MTTDEGMPIFSDDPTHDQLLWGQPNVEAIVYWHQQAMYRRKIEADRQLIHAVQYLLKRCAFDLGDSAAITILCDAISEDEEGEKSDFLRLVDEQITEKMERGQLTDAQISDGNIRQLQRMSQCYE